MGAAEGVPVAAAQSFMAVRVENVFCACFAEHYRTQLRGGAEEPLYLPAHSATSEHVLTYRGDYFASALHEVAHWCLAGEQRRLLRDFGYWYTPESRNVEQQLAFETVECKPQALEWFFSRACGYRFQVSVDNLDLAGRGLLNTTAFQRAVLAQALQWQQQGLPVRAAVFYAALCREFGTAVLASGQQFSSAEFDR